MKISKDSRPSADVITVSGKLDSTTAAEFDSQLREFIDHDSGRHVVLCFAEVVTLTSAPLRAILSLAKRLQRHHTRLFVASPSENALESLRISGFLKLQIFEVTDSVEIAVDLAQRVTPAPTRPATSPTPPTPSSPLQSLPPMDLPPPKTKSTPPPEPPTPAVTPPPPTAPAPPTPPPPAPPA
ncbi:MAG: STAS domain-containing protein, partial [Verrucomicrobiales bacterium]